MKPSYGRCPDCDIPLSRKDATHCKTHANTRRKGTPAQHEAARLAALAKRDRDRENARLAQQWRREHGEEQG